MSKNIKIILLFIIFPITLNSQDPQNINFTDDDGLRQGYWEIIKDGIKCSVHFSNDKKEGASPCYYLDGTLVSISNFINDKLAGKYIEYYENGSIRKEVNRNNNGVLHGTLKVFRENGDTIYYAIYYKGKLDGTERTFYKNGKIKVESIFINTSLKKIIYYRRNGKIKNVESF